CKTELPYIGGSQCPQQVCHLSVVSQASPPIRRCSSHGWMRKRRIVICRNFASKSFSRMMAGTLTTDWETRTYMVEVRTTSLIPTPAASLKRCITSRRRCADYKDRRQGRGEERQVERQREGTV